jgi:hypothetical protein
MLEEFRSTHYSLSSLSYTHKANDSITMEIDWLQNIEAGLCEQAEATQSTNERHHNLSLSISVTPTTCNHYSEGLAHLMD